MSVGLLDAYPLHRLSVSARCVDKVVGHVTSPPSILYELAA